jgi:hypothetical protein
MRGDQLARQWRIIWAIEASPNGLTVTEIAWREETGFRTIYRNLEALQAAGFPLYTEKVERANRWPFVDTAKFKMAFSFPLTKLMPFYFHKDFGRKALVEPLTQYPMIRRAVALIRDSRLYAPGHP